MSRILRRFVPPVGLALLLAFPAVAQLGPPLAPLPLNKSALGDLPSVPVPRDINGNPIPPRPATAEELAAQHRENERLAEKRQVEQRRADEERKAAEARRVADESAASQQLAEQKRFHDRMMLAVYVGLGLAAVGIGSRFFKSR